MKNAYVIALATAVFAVCLVACSVKKATVEPTAPALSEQLTYVDAPYAKLGSEAFTDDYAGKNVSFKAMFIGEWTITQAYQQGGISTKNRVFINHRDLSYQAANTGLGSSDMEFPTFALSIEKDKSDLVYELKRGDTIEVKGLAEKAGMPGRPGLHVFIHEIEKVSGQ